MLHHSEQPTDQTTLRHPDRHQNAFSRLLSFLRSRMLAAEVSNSSHFAWRSKFSWLDIFYNSPLIQYYRQRRSTAHDNNFSGNWTYMTLGQNAVFKVYALSGSVSCTPELVARFSPKMRNMQHQIISAPTTLHVTSAHILAPVAVTSLHCKFVLSWSVNE